MTWDDVVVAHVTKHLAANYNAMVAYIKGHKTQHENGGVDEISVAGLSGQLADGQTPLAHKTSHQNGGSDELDVTGLSGVLADGQPTAAHKTRHQNGGSDELNVAGLNGQLADGQTPLPHASTHASGSTDVITIIMTQVTGLVTALAGKEPVITPKNTAFNKNYSTTISDVKMNGTAGVGSVDNVSRIDHVHPQDTSRIPVHANVTTINGDGIADGEIALFNLSAKDIRTSDKTIVTTLGADDATVPTSKSVKDYAAPIVSPTLSGTPAAPTAAADTDTTQIATTAFVLGQASDDNPVMDSAAAPGVSERYSRKDHTHPSDTTKLSKATNITTINDTGIADGEIALFNLTNKDIRTSDKTIVTTLGSVDTTVPTSKAVASSLPNRNAIINGDCRVNQRVTPHTLVKGAYTWDSDDLTGPDRHEGMADGTALSAGTWEQTLTATAGTSGYAFIFKGVTLTGAGVLWHRTRIEAKDAVEFKNQIASFGCYVWHDTGSAHNYTIYVREANSADNFSAVTEIGHSAAQSVPSGGSSPGTFIKYENISMGDCSNGIEIEIKIECGAVTTKNFEQTELQIEKGSVCTAFENRLVSAERALCTSYCQLIGPHQKRYVAGTNFVACEYTTLCGVMRSSPSVLIFPSVNWTGTAGNVLYNGSTSLPVNGIFINTGGYWYLLNGQTMNINDYLQWTYIFVSEL